MRLVHLLRAVCLALPLFAALGTVRALAASEFVLDYDVYYGGGAVMKVEAHLDLAEGRDSGYAITVKGHTVGLLDKMKPFVFQATSQGRATGSILQPAYYATTTQKHGKHKALTVQFHPKGEFVAWFTPADDAEEPVPPELLEGSIDPASAVLTLVRSFSSTSACSGTVQVFDGKRRYDVAFTDLPHEMLQKTSYSIYSGEAQRCRLDTTPIFGFKPGKRPVMDESTIWFGQVLQGAPLLPVRIDAEISLGKIRLHLTSAQWVDQQASR